MEWSARIILGQLRIKFFPSLPCCNSRAPNTIRCKDLNWVLRTPLFTGLDQMPPADETEDEDDPTDIVVVV